MQVVVLLWVHLHLLRPLLMMGHGGREGKASRWCAAVGPVAGHRGMHHMARPSRCTTLPRPCLLSLQPLPGVAPRQRAVGSQQQARHTRVSACACGRHRCLRLYAACDWLKGDAGLWGSHES